MKKKMMKTLLKSLSNGDLIIVLFPKSILKDTMKDLKLILSYLISKYC